MSNVKISIWTFLFYKKKVREKVNLFKISKNRYFLLGSCTHIILTTVLGHLAVLFKKIKVASLVSVRGKLWQFLNVKSSFLFTNLVGLQKSVSKWPWSTLKHLQFWRHCTIPFPCKSLCFKITAELLKVGKVINVTFLFIEL